MKSRLDKKGHKLTHLLEIDWTEIQNWLKRGLGIGHPQEFSSYLCPGRSFLADSRSAPISRCLLPSPVSTRSILGRPLFLFPWGFRDEACLVMLVEGPRRVWPIHLQLLIMISASAGPRLVLWHRSSLLMAIGQRIRMILCSCHCCSRSLWAIQ